VSDSSPSKDPNLHAENPFHLSSFDLEEKTKTSDRDAENQNPSEKQPEPQTQIFQFFLFLFDGNRRVQQLQVLVVGSSR
jgi:hypothetical protein